MNIPNIRCSLVGKKTEERKMQYGDVGNMGHNFSLICISLDNHPIPTAFSVQIFLNTNLAAYGRPYF